MNLDDVSYGKIIDNLYDGVYVVDQSMIIRYWNKAAERISGFSAEEVVGRSCSNNILTHVDDQGNSLCGQMCPLKKTITCGNAGETKVYLHHKDGHRIPVSVRTGVITDTKGNVTGGVEIFSDITSAQAIESRIKELEEMALIDNLTRLANRNYINRELFVCFEEKKRFGTDFGVLFIDIDHFKKFNDTYGHDVGDRVLKFVAETLGKNSRPFDVIGRWGGEEFIGIIRNIDRKQLEETGNRFRMLIDNAYILLNDEKLRVTISLGATLVRDGDDTESLLKRADTLLYESKKEGRNRLTLG